MGAIFAYSLSSSLLLAAMYLVYKWMLAGEKQHRYNRAMLWLIYIAALGMPALVPALKHLVTATGHHTALVTGEIAMGIPTASIIASEPPLLPRILLAVYVAGALAATAYTIAVAVKLHATISKGERRRLGRYTLVITPDTRIAPFSWFRYIVMSSADHATSGHVIAMHETRHLDAHHWVDLLLAQMAAVFQWYNPAAWLMREELKTVHEFQADEAVITSGADPKEYQMLLIKKAVGARFPSLANSLNHSKLKKRVTMMYKSNSSNARRLRALALIPAGAIALLVTNIPAVAEALSETRTAEIAITDNKVTEIQPETQISVLALNGTASNIAYDASRALAEERDEQTPTAGSDNTTGNKTTSAVVSISSKNGKSDLSDVEIYVNGEKKQIHNLDEINSADIASIDIRKTDNTKKGIVYITTTDNKAAKKDEPKTKDVALSAVEQMPQYPGGEKAMLDFVVNNMKYPEEAIKAGKEGRVVVRFEVQTDGKVTNAKVIRSISPELDAEAVRVVESFPAFTPGMSGGKPVTCNYVIPISFKLSGKTDTKDAPQPSQPAK